MTELADRGRVVSPDGRHRRTDEPPEVTPEPPGSRDGAGTAPSPGDVKALALRTLAWILALQAIATGVQYLWPGVPDSAPTLQLMERFLHVGSMQPYGAAFAAAGLLICAGLLHRNRTAGLTWNPLWCMTGHAVAALINVFWAGCAVGVLVTGTATGAGITQPLGYAALHCAGLFFARWANYIGHAT